MNMCCIITNWHTYHLNIVIRVWRRRVIYVAYRSVFACFLVTWLVAFRDWKFGFSGKSFNFELDSTLSLCWMCLYIQIPLVMTLRPCSPGVRGQQVWNHWPVACTWQNTAGIFPCCKDGQAFILIIWVHKSTLSYITFKFHCMPHREHILCPLWRPVR